jgi:DNA-binding transcriptional regulator YdaS (Cro superfamily)
MFSLKIAPYITMSNIQAQGIYDPNRLLNAVMSCLQVTTDTALARALKLKPSAITDVRTGHRPVSATLALLLEQVTGMTMQDIRQLMGDRRARFRLSIGAT